MNLKLKFQKPKIKINKCPLWAVSFKFKDRHTMTNIILLM